MAHQCDTIIVSNSFGALMPKKKEKVAPRKPEIINKKERVRCKEDGCFKKALTRSDLIKSQKCFLHVKKCPINNCNATIADRCTYCVKHSRDRAVECLEEGCDKYGLMRTKKCRTHSKQCAHPQCEYPIADEYTLCSNHTRGLRFRSGISTPPSESTKIDDNVSSPSEPAPVSSPERLPETSPIKILQNPNRQTSNSNRQTSNPNRQTSNPKLQTSNPKLQTGNPKSQTDNPKSQTDNLDGQTDNLDGQTDNLDGQTGDPKSQTSNPENSTNYEYSGMFMMAINNIGWLNRPRMDESVIPSGGYILGYTDPKKSLWS
jgi:hypothetical protein